MDQRLHQSSYILAGIGLIDSIYLSWVDLTHTQAFCGGSGDCQTVANSPYSEIAGIPIALLGIGGYVAIIVLLFLETRSQFWSQNSPLVIFGITLAGTLYSAYLTYPRGPAWDTVPGWTPALHSLMTLLMILGRL